MTTHPRLRDREHLPGDEELLRALRRGDVEGSLVLPSAVDVQGTSVHRLSYLGSPEGVFGFVAREFTGAATVTPNELPGPIANPNQAGLSWEFFAIDDPFVDEHGVVHTAHAEIRAPRLSDRPAVRNVRPRGAMKQLLRHALSGVMRIRIAP